MRKKLQQAVIRQSAPISSVFDRLNDNKLGIVFTTDDEGRVVGCVTDGDIRRQLLKNNDLSTPVSAFMNRDFVWAKTDTPREQILKLLDHGIRLVPVLDGDGRLVDLCGRESFQIDDAAEVFARAQAPARISFCGGGSDLTQYFIENGGVVINSTINKYAYATLRRRRDSSIRIYSHDLSKTVEAKNLADLNFDGNVDLIKAVIKLIAPEFGFELEVSTDFPVGSGLGGSATLAVAVIGSFNEFRTDAWTRYQIAEMAFQAERLILNIPGGWQDQYAAAFGGFNYMEFNSEENLITPLRLESQFLRELESDMILCYTKKNHNSGNIHADQRKRIETSADARAATQSQKEMAVRMKQVLLRGDIMAYGRLLHQAWLCKRQLSDLISNPELDKIYDCAMANGALGGKILGAGGGGYFLFFAPPFRRYQIIDALANLGYETERVSFDERGLVSWKNRLPAALTEE